MILSNEWLREHLLLAYHLSCDLVLLHSSRQPHSRRAFARCVHGSWGDGNNVLDQLALCHAWITCTQHRLLRMGRSEHTLVWHTMTFIVMRRANLTVQLHAELRPVQMHAFVWGRDAYP